MLPFDVEYIGQAFGSSHQSYTEGEICFKWQSQWQFHRSG